MPYFTYLPNTQYTLDGNNTVIVKNIMVRAKILDTIRSLMASAAEYTVQDEEKPEHIAYRVYGRADYHWIILMFNEIHDPYFSWPMSINELERHMAKTYTGKALFINTGGVVEEGRNAIRNETRGVVHDRRLPHFEVGSTVRQVDGAGNELARATITAWDPDLWKIEIDNIHGVFRIQGEAARVDATTGQAVVISDPLALARDIRCTNSQGQEISASLLRITDDNQYSLHHFVDEDGNTVSPWRVPLGSASPLIERYVVGRQEVINTVDVYNQGTPYQKEVPRTYFVVTNWSYEDEKNDSKRNIKVMKPNYIDPLLRELSRVFS